MPRVLHFTAKNFGAYEADALVVGFAQDHASEVSDEGLILQRAKEGEDDSGIYVEIPIQRHVCYDGIQEAALARDSFTVVFLPDAIDELGGIAAMTISFASSDSEFESLEAILKRIFRGHETFTIQKG